MGLVLPNDPIVFILGACCIVRAHERQKAQILREDCRQNSLQIAQGVMNFHYNLPSTFCWLAVLNRVVD
jgi:hypothetical protein